MASLYNWKSSYENFKSDTKKDWLESVQPDANDRIFRSDTFLSLLQKIF